MDITNSNDEQKDQMNILKGLSINEIGQLLAKLPVHKVAKISEILETCGPTEISMQKINEVLDEPDQNSDAN